MTTSGGSLPETAFGVVLDSVPAALYVSRVADGRVLFMNPRAQALLGLRAADLRRHPTNARQLWVDQDHHTEVLAQVEAEGHVDTYSAQMRRPNGTIVDVLGSIQSVEIDGEACIITVAWDISERSQAEEALRRSERRLRQIAENIDEGFVLASLGPFRVHYANPAYAEIMGVTMEEVYGEESGLLSRIHTEDHAIVRATVRRLRAGLTSDQIEVRLFRHDELRWVQFRWCLVEDEEPEGMLAMVVEDVTERRRDDVELRRARRRAEEASEAKSSFLSRVSHELRTPLNVILGFGQLLETEDLDPAQQESVGEIMGAGRHLLHLVDKVLEISRAESGQLGVGDEVVAVGPVIHTVLEGLRRVAARRGIEVRYDDSCPGDVRGDPRVLTDALRPLVENAIVHNVDGGTVDVSCEDRPGARFRISVTDTGPGLTPEDLDRVFVPFERTRRSGGAGLGLPLARRLVESMGGELGARSVPGRGSSFWIDLDRAADTGPAVHRLRSDPTRRRRVLYVEDNESNAELASRALAALRDVDLVVARHGAEGLDLLASDPFDLVLLDLHLPDIEGEEILGRIRAAPETAALPVVVISADASPEVVARLRASGADDYLVKPVSIPHLVRLVDREAGDGTARVGSLPPVPPAPAPTVGSGVAILDRAVLDDLSVLEDVEPGTPREVVELFARSGGERVTAMEAGVADGDLRSLAGLAHALRGSGANLGATVLADACRTLEQLVSDRGGDAGVVAAQVASVRTAFDAAVAALREHVAPPAGG